MTDNNIMAKNLETFLNAHAIKKDENKSLTHTQFSAFITRTFHIPPEDYGEYMQLYYHDIIKSKKTHNIIERQFIYKNEESGPCLVDLDFQFSSDNINRQYTSAHIDKLIQYYLDELSLLFEMDEDLHFIVVVQEKPNTRCVTKANGTSITKDGIHLMFCVQVDPHVQQLIREKVLKKVELWEDLPITNTWDDVIDKAISTGSNGWLCVNSKKKDDQTHYSVTQAYNVYYDTDSNTWVKNVLVNKPQDVDGFYAQHYKQLFVRNPDLPKMSLLSEEGETIVENYKNKNAKPSTPTQMTNQPAMPTSGGDEQWQISVQTIMQITNKGEVETLMDVFLDNLPTYNYDIREAYEYAMCLSEDYYGAGSYNKWIKVGFALRNISIYLLIVWVNFSMQSSSFQFTDISKMCEFWIKFNSQPERGVTKQSLMYWCRNEDVEKFNTIRTKTVDYYLDQSVESLSLDQLNARGPSRGSCDYDIASLVFQLKKGMHASCGIRNNEWYSFKTSYWQKDDSGTSLRTVLSNEVRGLYMNKSRKYLEKAFSIKTNDGAVDIENEEHILLKARANMMLSIATRLGNTRDKDNIMKECRELFYDKEFEEKLDKNRYLLCFKNGVVDFKEKRFRRGLPEDYISKCTMTDFSPLDEKRDKVTMDEITEYFKKLFPLPELNTYMWNHMASIIIGDSAKVQCLHYYIGIGQNGKSMMVKLLEMIMGDYAVGLDATFFTKDRPARGAATPDVAKLPGARLAVTTEPTEGAKPVVLYEGPMKQLTSGTDKISYRALFKDQTHFVPQCHCIIQSNDYIPIRSRDHGTWRRIRVVPFVSLFTDTPVQDDPDKPHQFLKEDGFEEKFEIWVPVFMAMLVKLAFVNQGALPMCDYVKKASEEYRRRQDYLATFMEDHLEKATKEYVLKKSELLNRFNEWYKDLHGEKLVGKQQEIFDALDKKYGAYNKNRNGWVGVRIMKVIDTVVPSELSDSEGEENESLETLPQ
jgi:P4 family phage/plasmid primase-like protien